MPDIYLLQTDIAVEVVHGKRVGIVQAIEPYIPKEQRIGYLGIAFQESGKVQNKTIVQRSLHTNLTQTFGKTVKVFNSITVSLKDIRIAVYLAGHVSGTLQQKIIVTVYTSDQTTSQFGCIQGIHQYHLLTFGKGGGGRKHYLKIAFFVFELG